MNVERPQRMLIPAGLTVLGFATLVVGGVLVPLGLAAGLLFAACELVRQPSDLRTRPWGPIQTAGTMLAAAVVSVLVWQLTDGATDGWQLAAAPVLMLTAIATGRLLYRLVRPDATLPADAS